MEKKNKFIYEVDEFFEKPDLRNAKNFLVIRNFIGILECFYFLQRLLIREMNLHSQKTLEICKMLQRKIISIMNS